MNKKIIAKNLLLDRNCQNCTYATTYTVIDNNSKTSTFLGCRRRKFTNMLPKIETCEKWKLIQDQQMAYGTFMPKYTTEPPKAKIPLIFGGKK